jgi:hypothetical protein
MSVLDALCYPHLIDLIISHTTYSTLLRLRATSHFMRNKADTALHADRLILTASHPTYYFQDRESDEVRLVVSTPQGRLPAFAHWDLEGKTVEQLEKEDVQVPEPGFARKYTIAVDLVGSVLFNPYTCALLDSLSIPDPNHGPQPPLTLRLRRDVAGHHPSNILAITPDNLRTTATTVVNFLPFPLAFAGDSQPCHRVFGPAIHTVVDNMWLHPDDTLQAYDVPTGYTSEGLQNVYIFHRANEPCHHRFPDLEPQPPFFKTGADLLELLTTTLAYNIGTGIHLTLVDIENIPRTWIPNTLDAVQESFMAFLASRIPETYENETAPNGEVKLDTNNFEDCLTYVKERITILSLAQYRENIASPSAAQTDLETVVLLEA